MSIKKNNVEEVTSQTPGLTPEQLARLKNQSGMTGDGIRLPVLDRISLNGNCDAVEDEKGNLVRPPVDYRVMKMTTAVKGERPETVSIGSPLEVIFVKIRRRLIARDKKGVQIMSTTQHSHKDSIVSLWKEGKCIATGKASDLREQYEGLKTIQEVYVLLNGVLNLLIVKGSSFGSTTRDKKYPSFYEYLQQISKDGIFSHVTILNGVKEKGEMKDYYTMTFSQGRAITPAEQIMVLNESDRLTEIMTEYDKENAKVKEGNTQTAADEEYDNINKPTVVDIKEEDLEALQF